MPPEISQIEEERRADFNRSMLQSKREEENDDKLEIRSEPIVAMSLWERFSKYWPILIVASFFDLLAIFPVFSVVFNFCFGGVMFWYFGKKRIIAGTVIPIILGSVFDFFLSILPVNLAAAITRIALKETVG